jgi:hypothetical protein
VDFCVELELPRQFGPLRGPHMQEHSTNQAHLSAKALKVSAHFTPGVLSRPISPSAPRLVPVPEFRTLAFLLYSSPPPPPPPQRARGRSHGNATPSLVPSFCHRWFVPCADPVPSLSCLGVCSLGGGRRGSPRRRT